MPWTLAYHEIKDANNVTRRVRAYTLNGSSPVEEVPAGTIWGYDVSNPTELLPVGVLSLNNGDALQVVNLGDSAAKGTIEPGQPDSGDKAWPVGIGGIGKKLEQTPVAENTRVKAWWDLSGRLVVLDGTAVDRAAPYVQNVTASGNTTLIAAPGSGLSIYVKKAILSNNAASKRKVALQDGTGGTARFRGTLAADGGGYLLDYGFRGWKLTTNTLLNANLDAAGDIEVNIIDHYIAA